MASGQEGEQKGWYLSYESVRGLRSKFNSLGRSLHLRKGIGIKGLGVLCLGVYGTGKAGGADAEGFRQE